MNNWWGKRAKQSIGLSREDSEFLPAALEIVEKPPSPLGRMMLWTVVALIIAAVIWSIVGHVDEVAVAPGKIIPVGFVKVVQSEDKGVVKTIHVKDGQKVHQGDVLIELDTTFTAADLASIEKEIAYYNLQIERLLAEQGDTPFNPIPYPGIEPKDLQFQLQLYQSRQNDYHTKFSAAQANVEQQIASLQTAVSVRDKYLSMFAIAREKEERIRKLVDENAIDMFTLLDHQSKRLELEQNYAAQVAEVERSQYALNQARQQLQSVTSERDKDITTQLVDARKQLLTYQEQLKKAQEKNRLATLIAPIDGRVQQLAVHTVGGVVTEAQPLLMIVPDDVTLEVECWVANKDIGFIREGQEAKVKVETFNFQRYGLITGQVSELSPDSIDDKDKGQVYRCVVQLSQETMRVGDQDVYLGPGMTVTSEIKIKDKRIIEFFLDPFKKYQSEALRER